MEEVKKEKELKKNKKKNKVASLLLALALILTCGVAGTIAQYQKSFGGTSTATVAKFDVKATGLNTDTTQTINLFNTVVDTAGRGSDNVAADTEVKNNTLIAPGTQGCLEVLLANDSEVDVEYALGIAMTKNTGIYTNPTGGAKSYIPLQFALVEDNKPETVQDFNDAFTNNLAVDLSTQTPPQSAADATISSSTQKQLPMTNNTGNEKKVYICWRWAFNDATNSDARNQLDTAIGEAIASQSGDFTNPTVTVTLKATQKD